MSAVNTVIIYITYDDQSNISSASSHVITVTIIITFVGYLLHLLNCRCSLWCLGLSFTGP